MRAVVQRVSSASVSVDGKEVASIGTGFLVLLGVAASDGPADAEYVARKIAGLRVFRDEEGKMNRSLREVGGSVLIVSQFTLYGDCRKGRRPSYTDAAPPEIAERLYDDVAARIAQAGVPVEKGVFAAMMDVSLVNDGPVTLLLDSTRAF
jgi:D-tyrosyl-tRNA(Tyr) deacylase